MSLSRALLPGGRKLGLAGSGPFPVADLAPLAGLPFMLPADDPWVKGRGTDAHGYLDAARRAWVDHPEYMDFLEPGTPCHDLKVTERDLYATHWSPWLGGKRVLDVGCGVGRFALPLLANGVDVWAVDADLDSLRRLAWRASELEAGRLDLSWSSAWVLPECAPVDVAIAAEVLCYVPDPKPAVEAIVARLRPGGALLISMEARWGWAAAPDVTAGSLDAALGGDGVVDTPGEGWVRTFTEAQVRALLEEAGLEVTLLLATHYVLDGPLEQVAPESMTLDEVIAAEDRCRAHPVWGPLNRIWTAVGVKPAG